MEENVALDSNKQKQFVKSLKGLKKLMKKASAKTEKPVEKDEEEKEEKLEAGKIKRGKVIKKGTKPRGLVYLSHIPHGFYENEMTQYFKQFGVVTNARVIRSKRSGRSKGYAFVEFKNTDVAQVVAETMNNYLMGKRLIKAVYIPPKDQRRNAKRKNWNDKHNPGSIRKMQMKKAYNSDKSENDDLKIARKMLLNLSNTKSKLKELGIDYDFFTPVDVPETLSDNVTVKKENGKDGKNEIDAKPKTKDVKENNKKKVSNTSSKDNDKKDESVTISGVGVEQENKLNKKSKKQKKKLDTIDNKKLVTTAANKESDAKINKKEKIKKDLNKKNQMDLLKTDGNEKQHEQKEQKLKNAKINPPEDFIKLGSDDNEDSDSSYEFDSDAYENMVNSDESDVTDGDDNDSDDELNTTDDDEEDEQTIIDKTSMDGSAKKKNDKAVKVAQAVNVNKPNPKQQQKNMKRGIERPAVQSKKPKFEKQNNKKLPKKQIKKRK